MRGVRAASFDERGPIRVRGGETRRAARRRREARVDGHASASAIAASPAAAADGGFDASPKPLATARTITARVSSSRTARGLRDALVQRRRREPRVRGVRLDATK